MSCRENPDLPHTAKLLDATRNRFGDVFLSQVNGRAFDNVGADACFDFHYGDDFFVPFRLHVVIGSDSGLLPAYVIRRGVPRGARYIFIEPPEILAAMKACLPEPRLSSPDIVIISPDQLQESLERLQFQNYVYLESVRLLNSIGAEDDSIGMYRELHWQTRQTLDREALRISGAYGNTPDFLEKQLQNLHDAMVSSAGLYHAFSGKTAVVLAGGPSLDSLLPWVLENRDRLVLLAVSRVCQRLHDVGLAPHMIFSVDPLDASFIRSSGMFVFSDTALFLHMNHATPLLLGQWSGRSAFLGNRVPWRSTMNVPTLPHEGPTVTHTAVAAALDMGFSRILLAGVDLCDSREGFSHAQGTDERASGPYARKTAFTVSTYGGWQTETDPPMACGIDILAELAQRAAVRGATLINLSAAAARVEGIAMLPPDQIALEPEAVPATRIIEERIPLPTAKERLEHYQRVEKEFRQAVAQFRQIEAAAAEALVWNDRLFSGIAARDKKARQRLDRIEQDLRTDLDDHVRAVKHFGIRKFLQLVRPDCGGERNNAEIKEAGALYYRAMQDCAGMLAHLASQGEKRAQARIAEETEPFDCEIFFARWEEDRQPGRALVWLKRHAGDHGTLADADRKRLEQFSRAFEEMRQNRPGVLEMQKINTNLAEMHQRLGDAFSRRNDKELEKIAGVLASHPDSANAFPYLQLCRGYLAEICRDLDFALDHYRQAIEGAAADVTQSALKRIASISLDRADTDNALLALECLSQIDPLFKPKYADLLQMQGRVADAINVYTDYLSRHGDDNATLLMLGQLYEKIDVADAARMAYEMVLANDPANPAARNFLNHLASQC